MTVRPASPPARSTPSTPDHELPAEYAEWEEKNAELFEQGENFTEGADPLDSAKLLEELQEEEKAKGWDIEEPSKASD